MTSALPANTPVLVGVGFAQQKEDDISKAKEAVLLMEEALRAAAADAGADAVLSQASKIISPQGLWGYTDPARLLANAVGAEQAKTVMGLFGITQQTLIGRACESVAKGEDDVVFVVGGEAKYRALRGQISGQEVTETAQDDAPDVTLSPEKELYIDAEINSGLGMLPVGYYAIMDSAYRHSKGWTVEQHRDKLGQLYAGFSRVAETNPYAWKREAHDADSIRNASDKNPMLAFPYTKLHNSSWNVDQASAMIICSVEKAQALGVPREKWVFPLASAESNYMLTMSQKAELHRLPGAKLAGDAAYKAAGISAEELDFVELYSCFLAAVEIYADELNIPNDMPLTVAGGMPFAGGPLNNYSFQSTCRMAQLLREKPNSKGLVSTVSGLLTKQAVGIWSTEPAPNGFVFEDVSEQARAEINVKTVTENHSGEGTIAGYTVVYENKARKRAITVMDFTDGVRSLAWTEDESIMQAMEESEWCGKVLSVVDGEINV